MERLNNAVKNGAISSVTSFISETGSGSAAELLSGRREMAETTSSTLIGVKDTRDAPGRTDEKVGSGAPAVFCLTVSTLSWKNWMNLCDVLHRGKRAAKKGGTLSVINLRPN